MTTFKHSVVSGAIRNVIDSAMYTDPLNFRANLLNSLNLQIGNRNGAYSFNRGSPASAGTFVDHEGVVKLVPINCARFQGARIAHNLMQSGHGISNYQASVVATGLPDAFGGNTAIRIKGNASPWWYDFIVATGTRKDLANLIYIRRANAEIGSILLTVPASIIPGLDITSTITSEWQAYSQASIGVLSSGYNGIGSGTGNLAAEYDICGVQMENVTGHSNQNPSEYISVGVGEETIVDTNLGADFADQIISIGDGWSHDIPNTQLDFSNGFVGVVTISANAKAGELYLVKMQCNAVTNDVILKVGNQGSDTSLFVYTAGDIGTLKSQYIYVPSAQSSGNFALFKHIFAAGSVDYLSIEKINHGSNVDGVRYFDYTNPNTVDPVTRLVNPAGAIPTPLSTMDGVLIEPLAINDILHSENFTDASWTEFTINNIASSISQIAGIPAFNFVAQAGTNYHEVYSGTTLSVATSGGQGNVSAHFKKEAGVATYGYITVWLAGFSHAVGYAFNLTTGEIGTPYAIGTDVAHLAGTAHVEELADGAYRFSFGFQNNSIVASTFTTSVGFTEDPVNFTCSYTAGAFLGYATGVQGDGDRPFVTSYIPTTTSAVQSNSDSLKCPQENLSVSATANDFTICYEFTMEYDPTLLTALTYMYHTVTGVHQCLSALTPSGYLRGSKLIPTVQFSESNAPLVKGTYYKVAIRYSSTTGVTMFLNGVKQATESSNTTAIDMSAGISLYIGGNIYDLNQCGLPIKNFKIYNKPLSDTKMQEITS